MIGILPAAGTAARIYGLPKFLRDTHDMVQAGRAYAGLHHTYDTRVQQLMGYLAQL